MSEGRAPWHRRLRGQVAISAAATAAQALVGVAAIPLGTLVLGPADYGAYALALAFVMPAVALSEGGAGILLAEAWGRADAAERADMLASLLAISAVLGLAGAGVIALLLGRAGPAIGITEALSRTEILLACAGLPLASLSSVLRGALVVDGRAALQAIAAAVQAAGTLAALLLLLFGAGLRTASLFGAFLAGQAVGLAVLALAMRAHLGGRPRRRWLGQGRRNFGPNTLVAATDQLRGALEGGLVTHQFGVANLGLLSHARLYQGMLTQGTNVLATPLWPVALAEARKGGSDFKNIRRPWDVVHLGVAMAGVLGGLWGEAFLHWFTHGRFDAASWILPVVAALVLLQTAGRPALAACYALGMGRGAAWVRLGGLLGGILVLLAAIAGGRFWLVVMAPLADAAIYRAGLAMLARRLRPVPFHDQVALGGIAAIALAGFLGHSGALGGGAALVAGAILCAIPAAAAWPSLAQVGALVRRPPIGTGTPGRDTPPPRAGERT